MKKILVYALLFTHLCTGFAFASDTHSEALSLHDVSVHQVSGYEISNHSDHDHIFLNSSDGSHSDHQYDNHHCHGSAHLVGLIYSQVLPFISFVDTHFLVRNQSPVYVSTLPLLRPPIA